MDTSKDDKQFEEALSQSFVGGRVDSDFEKFKQVHADAIEKLSSPGAAGQVDQKLPRLSAARRNWEVAAAVLIVIGVIFGIYLLDGSDDSSAVWGQLADQVNQSHDIHKQMLSEAFASKDPEKISATVEMISDFSNQIGQHIQVKEYPQLHIDHSAHADVHQPAHTEHVVQHQQQVHIHEVLHDYVHELLHSHGSDQQIFELHTETVSDWIDNFEDHGWVNETGHICQQINEYAQEIMHGAENAEPDWTHITHCEPHLMRYYEDLASLPWNDPQRPISPAELLSSIERDLTIVLEEIRQPTISKGSEMIKRNIWQAMGNGRELQLLLDQNYRDNLEMLEISIDLIKGINECYEQIAYAAVAGMRMQQDSNITEIEAFKKILSENINETQSLGEFLAEEIGLALELEEQLAGLLGK